MSFAGLLPPTAQYTSATIHCGPTDQMLYWPKSPASLRLVNV